jgi:hypothetical protein
MSEISRSNVTNTGLTNGCKRGGCWMNGIVHNLYTCVSEQLKRQCRRTDCTVESIHPLSDCNPQLLAMVKNNTADICNQAHCEYTELHSTTDCPDFTEQTVLELVHIPGHREAKSHSVCDSPKCPMRHKHHMEQPCSNFIEVPSGLTELPGADDYVSDEIPTPGSLRRILSGILTIVRHPIVHGNNLIEAAVSALALLPMLLGVLNGFVAMHCAAKVGTTLVESSVPQPFVNLAVVTAYVSACMLAISHCSKNLSIPSGYTDADGSTYASSRFTQYIGRIQTGTALALVSVFVEAAAFMFYKI